MFIVYGGNCSWRKTVHNCVENVSLMAKRLEWRFGNSCRQQSKRLVQQWDKCISVGGGYVEN
jgi:hypothetical protein